MSNKPCYCLGIETVQKVADQGYLQTDDVDFVAASELFRKDPYNKIKELQKYKNAYYIASAICMASFVCFFLLLWHCHRMEKTLIYWQQTSEEFKR